MKNIYLSRKNEQCVVEYQSFWKLSLVLNSVLYIIPGSEFGEHHFLHRLVLGYSDNRFIPEAILRRLCYIAYYPNFLKNTLPVDDSYDWICQDPKKIETKRNEQ